MNLAQPYVKITNKGIASELDSLYVLIPANMEFEMEWKLAGLMGLVKDGTSTERIVQEKNYLVKHIVDYNDRHKWTPTTGPVAKYPPLGHVSVSFTHPDFDYELFLGPNLSRQPFPTTPTVKPQQGQQPLMIYTDLVAPSIVGNQEKGLLRTLDAGNTDINLIPGNGCIFLWAKPSLTALPWTFKQPTDSRLRLNKAEPSLPLNFPEKVNEHDCVENQ